MGLRSDFSEMYVIRARYETTGMSGEICPGTAAALTPLGRRSTTLALLVEGWKSEFEIQTAVWGSYRFPMMSPFDGCVFPLPNVLRTMLQE